MSANPHEETYAGPPAHGTTRGEWAQTCRAIIAADARDDRSIDGWVLTDLAARTFGAHALDDAARGHHDTTGAESTARKVDSLYRAHLLRAAARRIAAIAVADDETDTMLDDAACYLHYGAERQERVAYRDSDERIATLAASARVRAATRRAREVR